MIRLVVSDMDGTLLREDGTISKRNIQIIHHLQKRGIRFAVCTGRSYEDAQEPLAERGIVCDMICMNGAAVYDAQGVQVSTAVMSRAQVAAVLEAARTRSGKQVFFDFMTSEGSCTLATREQLAAYGRMCGMPDWMRTERLMEKFRTVTLEELMTLDIYKISVIDPNPSLLSMIRRRLQEEGSFSLCSSHHTNLEITDRAAQKGLALLKYAQMSGFRAKEIMAIGDSENDMSMMRLPLGCTVAVENAMECVLEETEYHTCSNQADGVACAIESLVFGWLNDQVYRNLLEREQVI